MTKMRKKLVFILFAVSSVLVVFGCSSVPQNHNFEAKVPGEDNHRDASYEPKEGDVGLGENPTLSDYLRVAALNNAGLEAAFEQWKMAVEEVPQVRSLPDPRFTYGYFIEEVETRVGPQQNKLEIMQTFPWFGKIAARTDAAAAAAKAAHQRYEAAKLNLFFEIKDAYYEYAYLAKAIKIAQENLELIKHFEEVARTKYMAAAIGQPDVIRAQVELARLEDHVKTLEQLRLPIVARLNAGLNRRRPDLLPWPRAEKVQAKEVDRRKVMALLRAQNPELKALDFERAAARSRVELAKKHFWPDVGVGIGWTDTGSAMAPGVPDSGKDPVILMFTMNVPIWRERYRAAERQAEADLRRASQQKTETENTIVSRAERALYDLEDCNRKMNLYGDVLVPKGEELLGASETAYRADTLDFLSLINAQQKLLEFQLQYERAAADYHQGLARLEMLVGSEF
jgi:cobalt-zinc-cadmium efflux system outer membrane protein